MIESRWIAGLALVAVGLAAGSARADDEPAVPELAGEPSSSDDVSSGHVDATPVFHASLEEGLGARSADGRFGLRIGGLLSMRAGAGVASGEDAVPFADVRLARVALAGHVVEPWITFALQAELAGAAGPRLLDAEASVEPLPELRIRVGQYRTPFSREFITPIGALALPERSVVSDWFRAGRDTGITVQGMLLDGTFEYYAGVFNGNGINAGGNENPQLMYLGRLVWSPHGRFAYDETQHRDPGPTAVSFGVDAYHDRLGRTHDVLDPTSGTLVSVPDPDLVRTAVGGDIAMRVGPVLVTGELFVDWREVGDGPTALGAGGYLQAGVMVVPRILEVAGRLSLIAPDTHTYRWRGLQRVELGGTGYVFGNHLKLQLRYAFTAVDPSVAGLPVPPVDAHEVVLQGQVSI